MMTDVVVKLPIQPGEEALRFGRYLSRFMERRSGEAQRLADESDAPFVMIRGDPAAGEEAKVLIFQETRLAAEFQDGWTRINAGFS